MKLFFQINKKLLPDVHNCFQSHAMSPERAPTFMVCWLAPPHQEQQPKHEIHIEYMIPFSPPIKKKELYFRFIYPNFLHIKKDSMVHFGMLLGHMGPYSHSVAASSNIIFIIFFN